MVVHDEPRFKMPEQQKGQKGSKKKEKPKSEVVKKIVTPEQADAFKSVVNKIAQAGHSEESAAVPEAKEPEGKTEILNAVLESLPEPEPKPKPRRRRVSSANIQKPATEQE